MNNFVTVVKAAAVNWGDVEAELRRVIDECVGEFEHPVVCSLNDIDIDSPTFQRVFDSYLAPAIAVDGGAIRFHSFE